MILLLCAAVWCQADSVETLIGRLGDDSPVIRDEAAAALIRRCDEAAPALVKRLPAAEGELWKLYDRVLQKCGAERRRRAFLDAPSKISISVLDAPLSQTLEDLRSKLPFPLPKTEFTQKITLEIKDMSPLEAFDRICGQGGLTWHAQWRGFDGYPIGDYPDLAIRGRTARKAESRRLYVKNFRVECGGLQISRRKTPFKEEASAWIGGMIQPSPHVGPVHQESFRVGKVVDDLGTVLHEAKDPPAGSQRGRADHLIGNASPLGHVPWTLSIEPPNPKAKSISVLGASARLRTELEKRYVALDTLEKPEGRSVQFEGLTLELTSFRRIEGKTLVGIRQQGRRDAVDASECCRAVGERLETAELRLRNGTIVKMEGYPRGMAPSREGGITMEYVFPTSEQPMEFRFVAYTVWALETVEFDFKDIPIPE